MRDTEFYILQALDGEEWLSRRAIQLEVEELLGRSATGFERMIDRLLKRHLIALDMTGQLATITDAGIIAYRKVR